MAKISQKELEYIKSSISPEQLLDLVSLKAKIDKRRIKVGRKINESVSGNRLEDSGFSEFYNNMDDSTKNLFSEVFSIFQSDDTGSSIQGKIYDMFKRFLSAADKHIANSAN